MANVSKVLELRLSDATMARVDEGGTNSAEAEALYLRGRGYLSRGPEGIDRAIYALQRAMKADTHFALAAAALSEAYRLKYRESRDPAFIELAQRVGDEAIQLNSSIAYGHVVRGSIYRDTGQHERAVREFQVALAADPAALNARQRLAEAYEAQGRIGDAEESYRKEIAIYPGYWMPRVDFGSFLIRHGRYAEAESNLLTASQNAPSNARVTGNLAGLYLLTERFAAAESELRRGLNVAPSAIGLNNLGWAYIYQGQMDNAVRVLEQAVKIPGADSTHWSSLARIYRWTKHAAQARTTYEVAIRLARAEIGVNPRNTRIRANLASLLAETGERRDALEELASTLQRAPTDVSALFRAAVVHELCGDRAAALDALEAAARGGY
jgi:Tfp pilus assembly protein PilF